MNLDHLWAGWRHQYVSGLPDVNAGIGLEADSRGDHPLDDPERCVFCRIAASGPPSADNGVVWRGKTTLAVLNAYPYASGHLLIMPLRHVGAMADLTQTEGEELWNDIRDATAALQAAYHPEGINLGANFGRAAGAGIPRHLHFHAVPRWLGDTNFMTTVAGARVLPETLADSWARLHPAWPA
ncbi:MAG TPA: HIT domain-containing protein [Acidimicrobiales bacterium]|nr:HIT domain-containing protein [Acidimicrobiales bacterium]